MDEITKRKEQDWREGEHLGFRIRQLNEILAALESELEDADARIAELNAEHEAADSKGHVGSGVRCWNLPLL